MHGKPCIAEALQLQFPCVHRWLSTPCCTTITIRWLWPQDDSLNGWLVSPAGNGKSTVHARRRRSKPEITLIRMWLNFRPALSLHPANQDRTSTIGTKRPLHHAGGAFRG